MRKFIITSTILFSATVVNAQQKAVAPSTLTPVQTYKPSSIVVLDNLPANVLYGTLSTDSNGRKVLTHYLKPPLSAANLNMPIAKLPNTDINMPIVKTDQTKYNMPVAGESMSPENVRQKKIEMLLGPKKP